MIKVDVYTAKGEKKGKAELPYGKNKVNNYLLAQAMRVYEDNSHPGTSKVKTRGEVTASTRKIYRQKGTGGARHGAKSAPIFVGGGVAHGPKGVKRTLRLSKKLKRQALTNAILFKSERGEIVVVNKLGEIVKTKQAQGLIDKLSSSNEVVKSDSSFLFVLDDANLNAVKAFRNLKNVQTITIKNLNAYKVMISKLVIIDKAALTNIAKTKEVRAPAKRTPVKGVVAKRSTARKPVKSTVKKQVAKKGVRRPKKSA